MRGWAVLVTIGRWGWSVPGLCIVSPFMPIPLHAPHSGPHPHCLVLSSELTDQAKSTAIEARAGSAK